MIFNTKEEREQVIIDNIDLVHSIAARYAEQTGIDVHELESYGYEGLILGIDGYNQYNPTTNKNSLRKSLSTPIKRSIEKYINFINSYYEVMPDSLQQHKEDLVYSEKSIISRLIMEEWNNLLNKYTTMVLTEKEKIVLKSYYGLNDESPKDFNQIGKEQGYSHQNAWLAHQNAIEKLEYRLFHKRYFYREIIHDIDAETGYAKRKRRK